ncbi:unnamed protein product [Caenorhabditis auriculariae]|uniref:Uncharacterized protein n=1 Tax=Caenorhabditis auriculariae TaxID=2777116 RepID=A0A8S1HEQ4_9PELO|nr:unnamed protein product [Caenorhabditis auriculariae]
MAPEIVTRVIYFFFPYETKYNENHQHYSWSYSSSNEEEDSRDSDYNHGHPHGHEMWGHGRTRGPGPDGQEWPDGVPTTTEITLERIKAERAGPSPPGQPEGVPTRAEKRIGACPAKMITTGEEDVTGSSLFATLIAIYFTCFILSFVLNVSVAAALKRLRWGIKLALMFHLCLVGSLLNVTTSLHFLASIHHLVAQAKEGAVILETFAIVAFVDNTVDFVLLFFVFSLALCCFLFYWNSPKRSTDWARGRVVQTVSACWSSAILVAAFLAVFEYDAHMTRHFCVRIGAVTSSAVGYAMTEILIKLKIMIPAAAAVLLGLSVRVGLSRVRRESSVYIEATGEKNDRELLFLAGLTFLIYEAFNIAAQVLLFFCPSPMVALFFNHFLVLLSTTAAPIAVLVVAHNARERYMIMYSCWHKGRTAPVGSYVFTTNKYKPSSAQSRLRLKINEHHEEQHQDEHQDDQIFRRASIIPLHQNPQPSPPLPDSREPSAAERRFSILQQKRRTSVVVPEAIQQEDLKKVMTASDPYLVQLPLSKHEEELESKKTPREGPGPASEPHLIWKPLPKHEEELEHPNIPGNGPGPASEPHLFWKPLPKHEEEPEDHKNPQEPYLIRYPFPQHQNDLEEVPSTSSSHENYHKYHEVAPSEERPKPREAWTEELDQPSQKILNELDQPSSSSLPYKEPVEVLDSEPEEPQHCFRIDPQEVHLEMELPPRYTPPPAGPPPVYDNYHGFHND